MHSCTTWTCKHTNVHASSPIVFGSGKPAKIAVHTHKWRTATSCLAAQQGAGELALEGGVRGLREV